MNTIVNNEIFMLHLDGNSVVLSTSDNGARGDHSGSGVTGASSGACGRDRGRGRDRRQGGIRQPTDTPIPWQEVDSNSDEATPILPFTEPVGPRCSLTECSTPFDFYSQLVDRSVVEILVTETNK